MSFSREATATQLPTDLKSKAPDAYQENIKLYNKYSNTGSSFLCHRMFSFLKELMKDDVFYFSLVSNFTYQLDLDIENFSDIQTHYKFKLTLLFIESMNSPSKLHGLNRRV